MTGYFPIDLIKGYSPSRKLTEAEQAIELGQPLIIMSEKSLWTFSTIFPITIKRIVNNHKRKRETINEKIIAFSSIVLLAIFGLVACGTNSQNYRKRILTVFILPLQMGVTINFKKRI